MEKEKELAELVKEAEELFKTSILTREDTVEISRIRDNFKAEAEEAMGIVYLETKKKYIQLEKDYLENIKKHRILK